MNNQGELNELALFAGAGGGILGGKLLGWRTVCAVEWEPYPASVLCARQNDGFLPPFPVWDDVQTFDGKPWRGIVDVVSGGFPCQDISAAVGGLALMESAAGCGEKWRASFTKYSPDLRLWKTHQCSLLGDLEPFLETWPQWGLMRDGECWEQQMLAQTIRETEFGSLQEIWPTPRCQMSRPVAIRQNIEKGHRGNLEEVVAVREKWPTPTVQDSEQAGGKGCIASGKRGLSLHQATQLWPTPTVCGNYNRKGASATSGDGLATAVKTWATPVARDYRSPGRSRLDRTGSKSGDPLPQQAGGKLNPTWVEWLMGWPLGWTDLKPLAMGKCHSVPQQLGESCNELL